MIETVRQYIQAHRLIDQGDRVIVAVSGGPDSVALLHVLHSLQQQLGFAIHVFHLDHGLRGDESAEDALYVRRLAERLGVPSSIVGLGPDVLRRRGGSLQAAARAARMEQIQALARRIGATRVAVGHTRDDQAETVLMRMLRGSGPHGLAGIRPLRRLGGLTYIRPLLEISRRETEGYCTAFELSPRLDPSNLKPDYLRNRIRLELLPLLAREYNPAISAALVQLAAVSREESDFLDTLAAEALARCRAPGEEMALVGGLLLGEPVAVARRVVRLAARETIGPDFDLGLVPVNRVLEAAARPDGARTLALPGGLRVDVEYGVCRFTADEQNPILSPASEWPVSPTGTTVVPELGLRIEAANEQTPAGLLSAAFDADRLPGPLLLRLRRPGDRIWPVGMEGSKKLQDILVDAKVPRRQRDRMPVLTAGDEVLWLVGHRLDRRFLAGEETRHPIALRVTED